MCVLVCIHQCTVISPPPGWPPVWGGVPPAAGLPQRLWAREEGGVHRAGEGSALVLLGSGPHALLLRWDLQQLVCLSWLVEVVFISTERGGGRILMYLKHAAGLMCCRVQDPGRPEGDPPHRGPAGEVVWTSLHRAGARRGREQSSGEAPAVPRPAIRGRSVSSGGNLSRLNTFTNQ